MKIITFLLAICFLLLHSNKGFTQESKISFELTDVDLKVVLDRIESTTNFKFIYKDKTISDTKKITIKAENESISAFLDRLFSKTAIQYEIIGNQIVLTCIIHQVLDFKN